MIALAVISPKTTRTSIGSATGAAFALEPDAPVSQNQRDIKEVQIARQALVKDRTRLMNRLKTQTPAFTRRQTAARMTQITRQISDFQAEMQSRLNACPDRARAHAILRPIPGIGDITAAAILIECPEVGTLTGTQTASLAGLALMTRQSGRWRGAAFRQRGREHPRRALYLRALVASRFNPDLQRKHQAMIAAGKPPKAALIALMRNLIQLANTLLHANRKWTTFVA